MSLEAFELQISRYYPGFFIPELIKKAKKMRQIKFRIYDKINKRFVEDLSDFWVNATFTAMKEFRDDLDGETIFELNDTLEFQQFTGVLDKNGKEIYDGDILSFEPSVEDSKSCIWKNLGYVWIPDISRGVTISYNHPYSEMSERFYDLSFSFIEKHKTFLEFEVIGNIFENPELT